MKLSIHLKLTSKLSPGFHVTATLQCMQNGSQTIIFLHLHLVFTALVNNITQRPSSDTLHLLIVTVEELQELFNPSKVVYLETRVEC